MKAYLLLKFVLLSDRWQNSYSKTANTFDKALLLKKSFIYVKKI